MDYGRGRYGWQRPPPPSRRWAQGLPFVTGSYHAGCSRSLPGQEPVAPELLAQAAETLSARRPCPVPPPSWLLLPAALARQAVRWPWWELPDADLPRFCPRCLIAVCASARTASVPHWSCSAALAAGVMRKGSICVTAPEQPKAVVSELIVAAGKADCELVVPDPDDITFLEASSPAV